MSAPDQTFIYKYPGQTYLLIAGALCIGLFIFLAIALESGFPPPKLTSRLIIWAIVLWFLILEIAVWRIQADIIISEEAVARRTWKWTWNSVRWDAIRKIQSNSISRPNGKRGQYLKFFVEPKKGYFKNELSIFDLNGNMVSVIEQLSGAAESRGIYIEGLINGRKMRLNKLPSN